MGKFLVKESKAGLRFNLVANNGEVIAASQVYKSASGCKNGIASVAKNAPVAVIEDQTVEGFKVEKHPKFEVYADKAGEFRFRLKATNGQIIAVSEGYKAMKSCLNGIASVKKNAADAKIVQIRISAGAPLILFIFPANFSVELPKSDFYIIIIQN